MKSLYRFILIFTSCFFVVAVQSQTPENKSSMNVLISAGVGDGIIAHRKLGFSHSAYKVTSTSNYPVAYVKGEYRLKQSIGVVLTMSYLTRNYDFENIEIIAEQLVQSIIPFSIQTFQIAGRCNWYVIDKPKFQFYGGFGIGVNLNHLNADAITRNKLSLTYNQLPIEMSCGARYFFTKRLGVYSEFGLCSSAFQGGLTFRF